MSTPSGPRTVTMALGSPALAAPARALAASSGVLNACWAFAVAHRSAAIVNETRVLFMASSITSAFVKSYQCETDVAGTRAPEAIQCW